MLQRTGNIGKAPDTDTVEFRAVRIEWVVDKDGGRAPPKRHNCLVQAFGAIGSSVEHKGIWRILDPLGNKLFLSECDHIIEFHTLCRFLCNASRPDGGSEQSASRRFVSARCLCRSDIRILKIIAAEADRKPSPDSRPRRYISSPNSRSRLGTSPL